jgi:3-oxoacid CoA-transferase subunit A
MGENRLFESQVIVGTLHSMLVLQGTAAERIRAVGAGIPVALVKAWKADRFGNLVHRKTAQNFNPMMAAAAKTAIAEVKEIVTPGVYVQRVVLAPVSDKRIERRTIQRKSA